MNWPLKLLFLDHRDSFSENLIAALRARGCEVDCVISAPRQNVSDCIEDSLKLPLSSYHGLILSPGPGRPEQYPLTNALIGHWSADRPLLGVCLGHQILLAREGHELTLVSRRPVHGRREQVDLIESSLWLGGVGLSGRAVFYNSWAVTEEHLNRGLSDWRMWARNGAFVAACEHKTRPWLGVQFHPESFVTEQGGVLLDAFVALLRARVSIEATK